MSATAACTVVVPLFNKGPLVRRALRSVLGQTFPDFELIVVDDGSTDDGPRVVEGMGDPRLRMIVQENSGVSAARNRGIAAATSPLVAFLDADDQWKPEFLATMMELRTRYPQCRVYASQYDRCYAGRDVVPIRLRGLPPPPWEGILEDYFALAARSDPPLWASAVAVARDALQVVGGFPLGVQAGEDLLTWARLATRYRIAYSRRSLATFHLERRRSALDPPTRRPAGHDTVGEELRRLLAEVPPPVVPSLKRYIALWHRMRASCYLGLGQRKATLVEAAKGLQLAPLQWKLYAYAAAACLPTPVLTALRRPSLFRRKRSARVW